MLAMMASYSAVDPNASSEASALYCGALSRESGARTFVREPMAMSIDSSSSRSPPRKERAAEVAVASRSPAMLKLRSSATAAESGNSPAANVEICCTAPSSLTTKSSFARLLTGMPLASVTVAYTSTTFTPERNCASATSVSARLRHSAAP